MISVATSGIEEVRSAEEQPEHRRWGDAPARRHLNHLDETAGAAHRRASSREDDEHPEGERLAEMGVVEDVTGEEEADRDRDETDPPARSTRTRSRTRRTSCRRGARARSGATAAGSGSHVTPVLPGARAEARCRLAPFSPEPVDRRCDHQDHQRDLEVEVDDLDPRLRVQREPVVPRVPVELVRHELREHAEDAERRDERGRERDAGEVRGDARRTWSGRRG